MDRYSAAAAARALETSSPRVIRAIQRLGVKVPRTSSGRYEISDELLGELSRYLGKEPRVEGLSRTQLRVLAALSRAPRGLISVRAVARRAGISPTAASHALDALLRDGLVRLTCETVAQGRARRVDAYHADLSSPIWRDIQSEVRKVQLPEDRQLRQAKRVPPHLRHLFWNTATADLDVRTSAPYIARRLLTTGDFDGLAWGAVHLPADAWARAAQARGLDPRVRALALNLARSARAAS